MAVLAKLEPFATEANETLDVELVIGDAPKRRLAVISRDSLRFEHDDFAAFGFAEIVRHAIHEEMIAVNDLHFDDRLSGLKKLIPAQARARFESGFAVIGRKPYRIPFPANGQRLINVD